MTDGIRIDLRVSIARHSQPEPAARFRLAWDDEISDYGYKCRTQSPGFVGPDNPPAVYRFYPSMKESGDYRVNLIKDPSWGWKDTFVAINGGDVHKWEYLVDPSRAQFNTTGWAQMAYLGMSGNYINVMQQVSGWVQFETLFADEWQKARSMSIETHPHLIHRFTCVSWKVVDGIGQTVRIDSTGTNRGDVFYPLVTNEGSAWIPSRFVVEVKA